MLVNISYSNVSNFLIHVNSIYNWFPQDCVENLLFIIWESISELWYSFLKTQGSYDMQIHMCDYMGPFMDGIIALHHMLMYVLIVIFFLVFWLFIRAVYHFGYFGYGHSNSSTMASNVVHGSVIELVWTIIPTLILIAIGVPTFGFLYSFDEGIECSFTLKAIAHQWYWSYEYSDLKYGHLNVPVTYEYDSFMVPVDEFKHPSQLRLLTVDNPITLPTSTDFRLIVTSADVLHSWAVPALGIKMDAVAGRLNQAIICTEQYGIYYGQCSELCGENHAFMPIMVQVVSIDFYIDWIAGVLFKAIRSA